jgi:hypothetical protein
MIETQLWHMHSVLRLVWMLAIDARYTQCPPAPLDLDPVTSSSPSGRETMLPQNGLCK